MMSDHSDESGSPLLNFLVQIIIASGHIQLKMKDVLLK